MTKPGHTQVRNKIQHATRCCVVGWRIPVGLCEHHTGIIAVHHACQQCYAAELALLLLLRTAAAYLFQLVS